MKKERILTITFAFALLAAFFSACTKDDRFDTDPGLKLGFSADTVIFDTVFTTIGSSSRVFMIYNPSKERVKISSIRLARGKESPFRINVDGISATEINDLEISGKDSLFVFVKVTIDPNQNNAPLIQTDSIVFSTNGNMQDVKLVAWGQDAHFYRNGNIGSDYLFTPDKPHVIYGFLIVDSLYTLTIDPGTRVHLHSGASLVVYRDATIKVNGTAEDPVIFEGDRLESYYGDIPGQWNRIWLYAGSINNEFHHAIIRNGEVGIHADTTGNSPNPTLRISNSLIYNMSQAGIFAQGSTVEAANCVIGNCGVRSVVLALGGRYDFRHCTIGNYWNKSFRRETALVLNNYYYDYTGTLQSRALEQAYFGNCTIYGEKDEEITFDQKGDAAFNYRFENCLLKTKLDITDQEKFPGSLKNEKPWFRNPAKAEFQPDTLVSALINKGNPAVLNGAFINLSTDLDGNSRIGDEAPDIGAYEFIEKEERK